MACTVNTSSNTNKENNGTPLPVHLKRKKTRRCAHNIHIRKTLKTNTAFKSLHNYIESWIYTFDNILQTNITY